jgi:uncharacterized membrane protein
VQTPTPRPSRAAADPEPPRRPSRRPGPRRERVVAWRIAALALVLLAALVAHHLGHQRPGAQPEGQSGVAYGQIVTINPAGNAAVVRLADGREVQAEIDTGRGSGTPAALVKHFRPGDRVQLASYLGPDGRPAYAVADWQRGTALLWLFALFVVVAAAVGRGKALRALLATAAGLVIIVAVVVPAILRGANPVLVTLLASGGILAVAMYFVHGLNGKTTAALCGTVVTVLVALFVGAGFIRLAHITSFGTEESVYLVTGNPRIAIQGLVLTGVVIGALGALVDVTVGQASAVAELARLGGPRLGVWELYERGMRVGLDHIGSLINTLVLAYVGYALPLVVLLAQDGLGARDVLNLELVGAQAVQTLVGALALCLAVPFTTLVAAVLFRGAQRDPGGEGHVHVH